MEPFRYARPASRFLVAWMVAAACVQRVSEVSAAEIARVGEASITEVAVREMVARQGLSLYEEASVRKGLEEAVRFELMAAEARRLGLDRDVEVQRRVKEILVERLLQERSAELSPAVAVSEAEQRAYYEAHTSEFRRPTTVRGPVLTIHLRPGEEAAARDKAGAALRAWKAGEAVEQVLRHYAEDPSERVGGAAGSAFIEGQPSRRYPEAVAQAMFSLERRGELAAPVETPRAIYLVGLTERVNGGREPFERVQRDVQRILAQQRREAAYLAYGETLKAQFPVVVDENALRRMLEQLRAEVRPSVGPGGTP